MFLKSDTIFHNKKLNLAVAMDDKNLTLPIFHRDFFVAVVSFYLSQLKDKYLKNWDFGQ